jgi:hypothetical protein
MLQFLGHEYPQITVDNLQRFADIRKTHSNQHKVCLTMMWAAAQAGNRDLKTGLNVWFDCLFPEIQVKAYSQFVINCLTNILSTHSNAKSPKAAVEVEDLFSLLDLTFSGNSLPIHLHKQLKGLYVQIKDLSFGSRGKEKVLFPYFLQRLNSVVSAESKAEILSCLVQSLAQDPQTFSVWRQFYSKSLSESTCLLEHLSLNWDTSGSKLQPKLFRDTLRAFVSEHQGENQPKASLALKRHCNDLLAKMSSSRFPWRLVVTLILLTGAAFVAFDIRSHGTFQKSETGKFLKESGALKVWRQSVNRATQVSNQVRKWISDHAPAYFQKINKTVGPWIQLFWERLGEGLVYLWEAAKPARVWFSKTVPPILETISDYYVPRLVAAAGEVSSFVRKYLVDVGIWLQQNVFVGSFSVENLQKLAVNGIETIQDYAAQVYRWGYQQYSAITSG